MLDFMAIGNKIRDLRVEHRFSQDRIAEMLYVSRQAVSRWEMGQTLPSVDNLIELSKIFHLSFEEILCMNKVVTMDPSNLFLGHDRMFVVKKILDGSLKVNLPDVFYQFSNAERIIVLKAIENGTYRTDNNRLWVKLMPEEQKLLQKKDDEK